MAVTTDNAPTALTMAKKNFSLPRVALGILLLVAAILLWKLVTEPQSPAQSAAVSKSATPSKSPPATEVAVSTPATRSDPPQKPSVRALKKSNEAFDSYAGATDIASWYKARIAAGATLDEKVYLAEALRRCWPSIGKGRKFMEKTAPALHDVSTMKDDRRKQAIQREREACAGFEAMQLDMGAEAKKLESEALKAGGLLATARELPALRGSDPIRAQALAQQIFESGDIAAIDRMSTYIALEKGLLKNLPDSTPALADQAWALAMCDLRGHCGPDGPFAMRRCIAGQGCEPQSYSEYLEQRTTRSDYDKLLQYRSAIVDAIQSGNAAFFGIGTAAPR